MRAGSGYKPNLVLRMAAGLAVLFGAATVASGGNVLIGSGAGRRCSPWRWRCLQAWRLQA